MRIVAVMVLASLGVACNERPQPTLTPPAVDAAIKPPASPAAIVPPGIREVQAEFLRAQAFVSVKGRIERPAGASGRLHVQLTDDACFTRQHVLVDSVLSVGAVNDRWATYSVSASVRNGSRVRACAAIIGDGKTTTWYGASRTTPPVDGEHAQFDRYDIVLASGAPIELP